MYDKDDDTYLPIYKKQTVSIFYCFYNVKNPDQQIYS